MHIVLFDIDKRGRLFPFTLTRAIADIRFGIFTIKERWEHLLQQEVFVLTDPYLQDGYKSVPGDDCVFIDATVLPSLPLVNKILQLNNGECLTDNKGNIAGRMALKYSSTQEIDEHVFATSIDISPQKRLEYPHQICQFNNEFIRFDYNLITKDRVSATLPSWVQSQKEGHIFIEEGSNVFNCMLNASAGPIYIGKDVTIMEGCMLRGPLALCGGVTVKMGAKIYGATTIGPNCAVGGEIKNSVIFANSNKAHDGYLGDSVIGEWCNLGAGTSNSNVKNNGGEVMQWNYFDKAFITTGNKCGVIMGDYSKTAINTSINTGTLIGMCCNVFGNGLTLKHIPDFSWGMNSDTRYEIDKAIIDIDNWKKMKKSSITDYETKMLKHIFDNCLR